MRKTLVVSCLALLFGATCAVHAATDSYAVREPGKVGVAQTVQMTATIKAIDAASRAVTLVGPGGKEAVIVAGPQVKNFAQLKTGDKVDVKYAEALVVELKKGGGATAGVTEKGGMARAAPGTAPGAGAARQVTLVGDVVGMDPGTQTVTLKGAKQTVDVKVRDPEQFKLISKGDQIQATYTEAVAVDVSPAK